MRALPKFQGQTAEMATYLVVSVSLAIAQVLLLPLVTARLDSAEYGRLSIGFALMAILMIVVNPGTLHAYVALRFDPTIDPRALFWSCLYLYLGMCLVATSVVVVGYSALPELFGPLPLYYLVAILAAGLAEVFFEYVRTVVRIQRQVLLYAWLMLARFVVANGVFLTLLYWQVGLGELKFVAQAIVTGVLVVAFVGVMSRSYAPRLDVALALRSVRLGMPFFPVMLLDAASRSVDRLLIERVVGLSAVGSFEFAVQLTQPVMFIGLSFMEAFRPIFYARLAAHEDCTDLLRVQRRALVILLSLVGVTLSLFASEIVAGLTRNDFSQAASIMPLVVLSQVIRGPILLYDSAHLFFRETKWLGVVGFSSTGIMLLTNAALLPIMGLFAAGIGLLAGALFHWVLTQRLWDGRFRVVDSKLTLCEVVTCVLVLVPLVLDVSLLGKAAVLSAMCIILGLMLGRDLGRAGEYVLGGRGV